jgi:hypothetical protein
MVVVAPPGASPKAMLEATRQLLHNHPGPHASPSAAEQWHHDVNQLIVGAINMPPCGDQQVNHPSGAPVPSVAHSRSLTAPRVPSAPHEPAASLATVDLKAKLERRHSGEDERTTIECRCERRRNLDGDFGVADATPVRQAARTPTSPRSWGLHGNCHIPPHGGLTTQVLAPLAREIRWESQPHRVPADLLHLDPHCRRE